jgi:hypothetical protein
MADSNQNQAQQPKPKSDTVKCRVLTGRVLVSRTWPPKDQWPTPETRPESTEVYAKAGDIVELPREQAEELAKRKFEGYKVDSQGIVASEPAPGGVKDPIVEILGAA